MYEDSSSGPLTASLTLVIGQLWIADAQPPSRHSQRGNGVQFRKCTADGQPLGQSQHALWRSQWLRKVYESGGDRNVQEHARNG